MAGHTIRYLACHALSPWVIGTLHYMLTRGPEAIREPLLAQLASLLSPESIARLIKTLKWLLIAGIGVRVNGHLNELALNNWSWKKNKGDWNWDEEVAVVTGGCSGIGKEIAKQLAAKGVKIAVLDVQSLPAELEGDPKITYVKCDVTSPSSIAEAAHTVRGKLGAPSVLVNNAGIGSPHSILDTSNEYVTKIFQINIISHFWLAKEFLPDMVKKNKGHIVGLASMASFVSPPGMVDYAATKSAVMAFHEGLGMEIKHVYKTPGVLNTVVHPSWVRTALVAGYESHLEKTQGELMEPEQVGRKIVDQIVRCRSGQLIIPSRLSVVAGLRAQPFWLQHAIRDFTIGGAVSKLPKR